MKFLVKHFYVAELEVEADTAEEALEIAATDQYDVGIVEHPTVGSRVKSVKVEFYGGLDDEVTALN